MALASHWLWLCLSWALGPPSVGLPTFCPASPKGHQPLLAPTSLSFYIPCSNAVYSLPAFPNHCACQITGTMTPINPSQHGDGPKHLEGTRLGKHTLYLETSDLTSLAHSFKTSKEANSSVSTTETLVPLFDFSFTNPRKFPLVFEQSPLSPDLSSPSESNHKNHKTKS